MNEPRWIHRLYAKTFGYFWLPCPLCGQGFGGHESGGCRQLVIERGNGWTRGKLICPKCTAAGLGEP